MDRFELLRQAQILPQSQQRDFVDSRCENNPALKDWLLAQLSSHTKGNAFEPTLQTHASDDVQHSNSETSRAIDGASNTKGKEGPTTLDLAAHSSFEKGKRIGPYKVLDLLGEGGMGFVYLAEQVEPVDRRVALKVSKTDAGGREVLARFEAERQAMAMMNHPNIARILDAGTTSQGQPFFAMEYVQGQTIINYCDRHRLSIEERLRLFCDVCSGVQHAHQKGIIHRDLKPSNILVALVDGKPTAKVIDFGLAKALESTHKLTDQSLYTGIGQVLGTLKYMSPEQAGLDSVDIDTRTDVYALGVILYELLTGQTPIDSDSIKGEAVLKVLELIREKDPVKPSTRLSQNDATSVASVTGQRQTDTKKIQRMLVGDLDWIVMKALEKDRTRRYDTAIGFAKDIQRFLENEPVQARPRSVRYRLQKYIRKHRGLMSSLAVIAILLVSSSVITAWLAISADRARRVAIAAERQANEAAEKEESLRKQAEQARSIAAQEAVRAQTAEAEAKQAQKLAEDQAARAENIMNFVVSSFTGLDPTTGNVAEFGQTREMKTIKEVLDETAQRLLAGDYPDTDPLGNAQLMNRFGNIYRDYREYSLSIELLTIADNLFREVLGEDSMSYITNHRNLANSYLLQDPPKSVPLYRDCVRLYGKNFGEDKEFYTVLLGALATALASSGENDEAIKILQRSIPLADETHGDNSRESLKQKIYLSIAWKNLGQTVKARQLQFDVYEAAKQSYGPADWISHRARIFLIGSFRSRRDWQEAIPLCIESIRYALANQGEFHPDTLQYYRWLAQAYEETGNPQEAWNIRVTLFRRFKGRYGLNDARTLTAFSALVGVLRRGNFVGWDQFVENELVELKGRDLELFTSSDSYVSALWSAAEQFDKEEQYDEALRLYLHVFEQKRERFGLGDPLVQAMGMKLLHVLRRNQSVEPYADSLARLVAELPPSITNEDSAILIKITDISKWEEQFVQLRALDFLVVDLEMDESTDSPEWVMRLQPGWLESVATRNFRFELFYPEEEYPALRADLLGLGYTLKRFRKTRYRDQDVISCLWEQSVRTPIWTEESLITIASSPENDDSVEDFDEVDQEITTFMKRAQIPGMVAAFSRDEEYKYLKGFGWADIENAVPIDQSSQFRIAAISQILTGLAIHQLVDDGKITLDSLMIEHLPQQCLPADGIIDERMKRITIRHLLQFSAGWSSSHRYVFHSTMFANQIGGEENFTSEDLIRYVLARKLDDSPGDRGEYSPICYVILGQIVEHVSGVPYETHVQTRILEPLGMANTVLGRTSRDGQAEREVVYYSAFSKDGMPFNGERISQYGGLWKLEAIAASHGWISTASDLIRLVEAVAGRRANELLSPKQWAAYFARPDSGFGSSWNGYFFANGWRIRLQDDREVFWVRDSIEGVGGFLGLYRWQDQSWATALLVNTDKTSNNEFVTGVLDEFQYELLTERFKTQVELP